MKSADPAYRDGKIVRSEEPLNLEMPFSSLNGFITSTELFYVRSRFSIPQIDRAQWRLRIEGEVEKPFEIDYDELVRLESRTVPVTLECAGNNRIFLEPKVKGVQWGLGAVGTAEWTGVPLSILLERAGVKEGALEVVLEGADEGTLADAKAPQGNVRFARSVPIEKARADILLVHKMNGNELTAEHGFPVRAIVPGWYAMASVKWMESVRVLARPFMGYYQTHDYAYWARRGEQDELVPLSLMQLKAEIASPKEGDILAANSTVRIHGAAWTGDGEVTKVEVSTNGGAQWAPARLEGEAVPNAWRLWEFEWKTPKQPEKRTLLARATDSFGRTQSAEHDPNRGTYMINHLLPIEVEVR
jgi:DMSO/TMAO reductase YedYZ molybdopterin-dependent catalytic subunit